jgi:acyl-CoA synthetase (AMP-forming)/AMP-acid ligase II
VIEVEPTVSAVLRHTAQCHGGRDWVVTPSQRLTFADAEHRSGLLAKRLLAAGMSKGRRVGMLFPQGPDFAVVFLAITRIGAVAIPLSTFARPVELRSAVRHTDVDTLLTADHLDGVWPDLPTAGGAVLHLLSSPNLRRVWVCPLKDLSDDTGLGDDYLQAVEAEVTPADPFVVISTSGSTAEPKAVVHSHGAQLRQSWNVAQRWELHEHTRTFTNMPFFWVGGLTVGLLAHLHVGGAVLTVERMDSGAMLDLIEGERPTRILGWTLLERLQADPTFATRDLPDRHLYEQPGPRHGSLGMTETGGPHTGAQASDNLTDLPDELVGSFGPPMPETEHQIVDPATGRIVEHGGQGEVWVRGPNVMLGLHRQERHEVFDGDGWLRTGDRGYFRDGLLFFTGRLTEMIKTGGANVAPREVELAAQTLAGVQAAFVVGLPDDDRGEIVGCLVGAQAGHDPDPEELLTDLRGLLSSFKVPRRLVVVPYADLPFQASGKLSRTRITELLG